MQINDREDGETEAVRLGPDRLTKADKQYIAMVRGLVQGRWLVISEV
jgi:hypothetical protein